MTDKKQTGEKSKKVNFEKVVERFSNRTSKKDDKKLKKLLLGSHWLMISMKNLKVQTRPSQTPDSRTGPLTGARRDGIGSSALFRNIF